MDKLEEHIRKNRDDLDKYDPPKSTWKGISRDLNEGKPGLRRWISIAAMIAVISGTAIIFLKPEFRQAGSKKVINNSEDLSTATPQLHETEVYYNNLVNTLYSEAMPMLTSFPEVKHELNTDLSHIDSLCRDLKKDLKDNVSNQAVIEALIQNYRTKIQILEDMLTVLKENDNKPKKMKSHEL